LADTELVRRPTVSTNPRDPLSFLPGVGERLGHYVYALVDPRDSRIFYVGKGVGDRAYHHARHAMRVDRSKTSEELKLDRIRAVHEAGLDVQVEIIRHSLDDEAQAFEVKAALIDALKLAGLELTNAVAGQGARRGWRPLEELVSEYAAKPIEIQAEHRALLIRLNDAQWQAARGVPKELYERTRASWVVAPARRKPDWAFAVYDGIVRGVYRIGSWERASDGRRWLFEGSRDAAMEEIYLWSDVSGHLPRGARNPITYVNC
jgi:hypothetical protein